MSSNPILVFAVTGILQALIIESIHSVTKSGSFIRHAPNIFFWTFLLGQPKLILISSYPISSAIFATSANSILSDPPT